MKDKHNEKLRKHSKSHNKRHNHGNHTTDSSDKYLNALKEKHLKDDRPAKKEKKQRDEVQDASNPKNKIGLDVSRSNREKPKVSVSNRLGCDKSNSKNRESSSLSNSNSKARHDVSNSKNKESRDISKSKNKESHDVFKSKIRESRDVSNSKIRESRDVSNSKVRERHDVSNSKIRVSHNVSNSKDRKGGSVTHEISCTINVKSKIVSKVTSSTKNGKHKDMSREVRSDKRKVSPQDVSKSKSGLSKSLEKPVDRHKYPHQRSTERQPKRKTDEEESVEDLARKKQRIESELQALDLEEAAEKRAEEKKAHRQKEASRHTKKKDEPVHIKEEPLSDNENNRKSKHRERPSRAAITEDRKPNINSPRSSGEEGSWGNSKSEVKRETGKPKDKPNFETSGKLAEDTNTYNGVVIKYNEPAEARKPKRRWRLYPFKGDSDLPFLPIHRQSAYLFGRTRSIADIPIDHPSCSKQHAVLQFRMVPYKKEDGTTGRRVRPYIIDLESSNGTYVNNKRVDPRCYIELMEKDVVKFGYSSREYVVLHEESKNDIEDDDVNESD